MTNERLNELKKITTRKVREVTGWANGEPMPEHVKQYWVDMFALVDAEMARQARQGKMNNLLPCPFCGGEAQLHGTFHTFWVSCLDCPAEMGIAQTREEAIADWNTRKGEQDART